MEENLIISDGKVVNYPSLNWVISMAHMRHDARLATDLD